MAIATGLAIGLGVAAAANAGAQIYGAHQAGKASKEAAKIQSDGARQAQRTVDSALLPYVNKGRETISTLGRLTAAPAGARFAAPDPTLGAPMSPTRAVPRGTIGSIGHGGGGAVAGMPQGARPRQAVAGTIGSMGMPDDGQMVTLRAPDGSMRAVPAALAAQFEQRGAVRVA